MINRREFISNTLVAAAAFSMPTAAFSIIPSRPQTTIIGIGGAGIGLLGKAKAEFGYKANYLGIDTKGEWNTNQHRLIDIDYRRRPYMFVAKFGYVCFPADDGSIERDWLNNYSLLEPVYEIKGNVIVLASLNMTMGGIISHRIIGEITERKNADITYLAIGPFSFEGKKAGMEQEYSRVYDTGSRCSRFEILSNKELVKPFKGQLREGLEIVDQKIVQRIGRLI